MSTPAKFTGVPRYRSTATPPAGESMIRSATFPRVYIPAKYCTTMAKGKAIKERRMV